MLMHNLEWQGRRFSMQERWFQSSYRPAPRSGSLSEPRVCAAFEIEAARLYELEDRRQAAG
jgi:hypothetical protein